MKTISHLHYVLVLNVFLNYSQAWAQLDDYFEPNNEINNATLLTPEQGMLAEENLSIWPMGDVDYFRFRLEGPGQAEHYVKVTARVVDGIWGFPGRVDVTLFRGDGTQIEKNSTPLSYGWEWVRISLANRPAGDYVLLVAGRIDSIIGWYDLTGMLPSSSAPTITTHPQSQTVTAGTSVTFSVVATGTPPLSYQWRKDGQVLSGQTGSTLTLANVQASHAGSYTVVVSNSAGQVTSNPASLTVNLAAVGPTITTQPQSQTVTAGASVTFSVVATGTPPLSYQWRKDGQVLSGQTGSTLTLANVQASHAGSYTVVVSNSAGQVTSTPATLTVNPVGPPLGVAERVLPAGYVPGVPLTVTLHLNAGETVAAFGVEDGPPEGWSASNISDGGEFDAQNRRVKWDPFFASSGRQRTLTYQVTPPAGASGAFAFVGVASFDGVNVPLGGDQAVSPGAGGLPPTITTQPQSQTVTAGASVTFTVMASGAPPLSYQWRLNRVPIAGATGSSLVLNAVQAGDAGSYTVVVGNAHGSVTSQPAILTVSTAGGVRLSEARFVPREGFRFKVTAPAGQRWTIEASTDLRQWVEIGTLEMTTGIKEFTDAEALFFPQSYYRLRQKTQ